VACKFVRDTFDFNTAAHDTQVHNNSNGVYGIIIAPCTCPKIKKSKKKQAGR
jgi:hypothetical protein